jgi:hypothetical protein
MIPKLRDIYNEIKVNAPGKINLKPIDFGTGDINHGYLGSDRFPFTFFRNSHQKRVNELDTDFIRLDKKQEILDIFEKLKIPVKESGNPHSGHFSLRIYKADKYFNFPLNEIKVNKPFQYKKAYGESHSYDEYIQNGKLTGQQADNFLVDIENKKILASFIGWNVAKWASNEDNKNNQYYKASWYTITNPPPYMTIPKLNPDDPNSWGNGAIEIINRNKELYQEIKVHKPGLNFPMNIENEYEAKRISIILNKLGYTLKRLYNKNIKWGEHPFVIYPEYNEKFSPFQLFFDDEKDQKNKILDYEYIFDLGNVAL